ncbi:MAG: ribose-phosphate diphosphokinase [Planctomycetota bacterium]|nr:ribose-phosphate pyrophosphokinase [Planctomycetota bacterium]
MASQTLKVFAGGSNRPLATKICHHLGMRLGDARVERFADGEVRIKIEEDVRGTDVFLVQPTCAPVDTRLMELLLMIDAFRRASAERITAVVPYFGYARQDRKDEGRVPISAKLVSNMITTAGAHRLLALDLHAHQLQGFFDIPVDHLYAAPVFMRHFKAQKIPDLIVVAPDVGSSKLARGYAKRLHAGLAIVDKRRTSDSETEVMSVIGEVDGHNVLLVDDMITTAGSITQAATKVKQMGARDIYIAATHAVLCGSAMSRLEEAPVKEIVLTDTIPLAEEKRRQNIKVLSVARLLGEAILRIHHSESVSSLFQLEDEE